MDRARAKQLLSDLGLAVGFGLLSLAFGLVKFEIPGIRGGVADLREIPFLAAAFHLRRGGWMLGVALVTSLATPAEGSTLSTFLIHVAGAAAAWRASRTLQRWHLSPVGLGVAWALFVAGIYYGLVVVPALLASSALVGLMPWSQVLGAYLPALKTLRYEVVSTATVTALYLVSLRQLTLLKAAHASLKASRNELAGILAAVPAGIALLREGRVAWANEQLSQVTGTPLAYLRGASLGQLLVPAAGTPPLGDLIARARPFPEVTKGEFRLETREGGDREILVHLSALPDREGQALSLLDVTERAHLQRQFHQAQKLEALGRVSGSIAHDFGNVLQVVQLLSQDCLEQEAAGESPRKNLERMGQAVAQGQRVIRQLLAFSRKTPAEPRPLDLAALVGPMEPMLRTLVGREVDLGFELASGLPPILADPGQVEQVLLNLLINARDAVLARPAGPGRIAVRIGPPSPGAGDPPGVLVLEVADTGIGMDEATCGRIFEPFFSTKGEGAGSGLGLATVYGIVQHHGGQIRVQSTPGEGTTFRVLWLLGGSWPPS